MKRTALVLAVLGAALVLLELLHRRYDRPVLPDVVAPVEVDAERLYRILLRDGRRALPALRAEVGDGGPEAAALAEALPQGDEAWISAASAAIRGAVEGVERNRRLLIAPRGRVMPGRPGVSTGAPPGGAVLKLAGSGSGFLVAPLVEGAWPAHFPDLRPGDGFDLLVLDGEGAILERARLEVPAEAELSTIRGLASRLARDLQDRRLRIFAQGVLAMSHGLDDRAAELLLDGLREPPDPAAEQDLLWRRIYLLDRRGDLEGIAAERALLRVGG